MDKAKDFEKGWEEYKAKSKKEIEEMIGIIQNAVGCCAEHWAKLIAEELHKNRYRKIPKDSIVLTREEYGKLKQVESEKDRLYEIKLDLEHQLIEKGWTDYEGADEIEERVRKETAEKFAVLRKYITEQFHHYHEVRDKAEVDYKKEKEEVGKSVLNNDWHRADAIMFILEKVGIEFDEIAKEITDKEVQSGN